MTDMVMKLDDIGRPAWIALMVVSFIVFWPIGLAVLAFLLWSGRMGCGWSGDRSRWQQRMAEKWDRKMERYGHGFGSGSFASATSGNRAFDEYREETLKRLEEEQREFRAFLERLRMAKDRSEFDQFMTERRNKPTGGATSGETPQPQS
ncbi:MAG: DUF2852 domain-containing protein [Hyphomicrobium sp.]|jgi:hypothetical protein